MTTQESAILVACDRVLGEIGRRDHMFGWLRVLDAEPPRWLSVDAYYPGNRLIVLCGKRSDEVARLCSEHAPTHGLRLLELAPEELSGAPGELDAAVERRLANLGSVPRSSGDVHDREPGTRAASLLPQPVAPPVARHRVGESRAAAAARGARFVSTHEPPPIGLTDSHAPSGVARHAPPSGRPTAPARSVSARAASPRPAAFARAAPFTRPTAFAHHAAFARRGQTALDSTATPQNVGAPELLIGLVLIPVLCLELYFGVARFAIGGGHVLLAFGLALDCCARLLGTVAARRAGQSDWLWSCALVGSPAVAMFALYGGDGEPPPEPGVLAGLVSLCACAAVVIAILVAVL